jgi:hypothetical protein
LNTASLPRSPPLRAALGLAGGGLIRRREKKGKGAMDIASPRRLRYLHFT